MAIDEDAWAVSMQPTGERSNYSFALRLSSVPLIPHDRVLTIRRPQRRLLLQDVGLHIRQGRPWLQSKLIGKGYAHSLVDVECVGLAVAAVQGKHQLCAYPFPSRMACQQRLELCD